MHCCMSELVYFNCLHIFIVFFRKKEKEGIIASTTGKIVMMTVGRHRWSDFDESGWNVSKEKEIEHRSYLQKCMGRRRRLSQMTLQGMVNGLLSFVGHLLVQGTIILSEYVNICGESTLAPFGHA